MGFMPYGCKARVKHAETERALAAVERLDLDVEQAFGRALEDRAKRRKIYASLRQQPAVTLDGMRVGLHLNAAFLIDLTALEDLLDKIGDDIRNGRGANDVIGTVADAMRPPPPTVPRPSRSPSSR